jgi:hypothetical protein
MRDYSQIKSCSSSWTSKEAQKHLSGTTSSRILAKTNPIRDSGKFN